MAQYQYIAVDFDGTLCVDRFPEIGEPKSTVISFIRRQAAAGAKIILHTCRENGTRRNLLDEAVEWCAAQGVPLFAVNENPDSPYPAQYGTPKSRKVYADLYIDDRATGPEKIEAEEAEEIPPPGPSAAPLSFTVESDRPRKLYENTVCPVCGATVHENPHWVHCPKNRALVCMRHCFKDGCEYLRDIHCAYNDDRHRRHRKRGWTGP